MTAAVVESKVNSSTERLLRKRLAAKLRQQRCRARKREALLAEQDKDPIANSSKTISTTKTKATKRPILTTRNEKQPVGMPQQHHHFPRNHPPMQPIQHRQEFNVHRHQKPQHYTSSQSNNNFSNVGNVLSFREINGQQYPRNPYYEKRSSYHLKHHQMHEFRRGPISVPLVLKDAITSSILPLMDSSIHRSSLNVVKTASTKMMKSKEELAIDAMLSLRSGEIIPRQANANNSMASREMYITRMRLTPYV